MTPPFKALDRYSFTHDAIDHVEQLAEFKVCCASESAYHPSLWSFLDEQDVRHRWWHPENCYVLDVGAAYGSYTLPALARGCTVTAWSPPYNVRGVAFEAEVLERSARANGFTRLEVLRDGLSDKEETVECDESGPFKAYCLDGYGARPQWLKIDAEGMELRILQGGEFTIRKYKPRILLENHLHLDADCERKCDAWLAERGYTKRGSMRHGTISHSFYEVA